MRITVARGPRDDGSIWEQSFELPVFAGTSVSNVLQYINRNIDGTLGYYLSCRRGMCAACVVRINGRNEMACVTPIAEGMVIEPTKLQLLVKDTVVHLGMPPDSEYSTAEAAFREPNPQGSKF
jgi:succinate dehydrogenase/fumarate reductase-like Fe-S protein